MREQRIICCKVINSIIRANSDCGKKINKGNMKGVDNPKLDSGKLMYHKIIGIVNGTSKYFNKSVHVDYFTNDENKCWLDFKQKLEEATKKG